MKNKCFLLPVLAVIIVFAMFGCQGEPDTPPPVQPELVKVTFNSHDGATPLVFNIPKNEALGAARMAQVTALENVRDGYDFKGWSLTKGGDAVTVNAESKWGEPATTYYGLWETVVEDGEPITITYHLNGFPDEQPDDYTAVSGEAIGAAALPALSEDGYNFLGWSETEDGEIIDETAIFHSNTALYARFEILITITYDLNGYPGIAPEPHTAVSGMPIGNAALPVLNESGYVLHGWSETATGDVVNADTVFTQDTTLYARFEQGATVTLTYDLNNFPVKPTDGIGYSSIGSNSGTPTRENVVANQPVFYAFAPSDRNVISDRAIGADALPVLETNLDGYTFLGWSTTPDGIPVSASEIFTVHTTLYARYDFTPHTYTPPASLNFDIPYDMHPLRANVPADFIRGADISNVWELEQYGGRHKNFDDQVEDIMKILIDNGVNYVRLRLWVDPSVIRNHYPGDGNNNIAVTKVIAARAKAAGMKVLIAYHYSDYWADPGQQYVPVSWAVTTQQQLYDALEDYTAETINELIAAGAKPDMVQLGNEIRTGLLTTRRPTAAANTNTTLVPPLANQATLSGNTQFAAALSAAATAVRGIDPGIKIMLQHDMGGASGFPNQFDRYSSVDYDIIGMSWYTFWSSHGSLDGLYSNIQTCLTRFPGKQVVVCESGTAYTYDDVDWPLSAWKVKLPEGYYDDLRNVYGVKNTNMPSLAATNVSNGNGFVSNSGMAVPVTSIPGNPETQARQYRALMDAVAAAGGLGVMWWGADWIAPVMGLNANVENAAVFDNTGKALPVLRVLGGIKGANETKPGKMTGLTASASGTNITLTWPRVHSAIAATYKIERATSASGTWTQIATVAGSDTVGNETYIDAGLAGTTGYYYRVSAVNSNGEGTPSDTANATTGAFVFGVPGGLRLTGTDNISISLAWNAVAGAASYKLYAAQATAAPADTAYAEVGGTLTGTTYTHSGLTAGDSWWYKVSAVYDPQGEGSQSAASSFTVGAAVMTASINMTTGTLDADFTDPLKAETSTDTRTSTDSAAIYTIPALYVANDATNLYVALDFSSLASWGGYENDRMVVWVQNRDSSATGLANTGTAGIAVQDGKIVQTQTLAAGTAIHAFAYKKMSANLGGSPGVAINATAWAAGVNTQYIFAPTTPAGANVIKFSIPLAEIAGAGAGDELSVFAAFSMGWNSGNSANRGSWIPQTAVTTSAATTATFDLGTGGLSYIVK